MPRSSSCQACATLLCCWSSFFVPSADILSSNAKFLRPPSAWTVPTGSKFGALSNLELLPQAENDRVNKGTVRVASSAVGLNFADVFTVLGYYKAANLVRGSGLDAFVPGIEFAGTLLEDVESNPERGIPTTIEKGDSCFGFVRFGSYADIIDARPEHIRRLPPTWSPGQGAAFLVNALTAWHGLVNVGGMPSREAISKRRTPYVVLVHSASGGVGLWASEIAAKRGARVVGVVGSKDKVETFVSRIKPLCPSAQCIIRAKSASAFETDLIGACKKAREADTNTHSTCLEAAEDGHGADLVMECYGGKYFRPSLDIINSGGSLSTYGSTTYNGDGGERMPLSSLVWKYLTRPRVDPGELTSRNVRVGGFNLIFLTEETELLAQSLEACVECLGGKGDEHESFDDVMARVTPPLIGSTFSFDGGAIHALKALRSGKTVGKVVLTNENNPANGT